MIIYVIVYVNDYVMNVVIRLEHSVLLRYPAGFFLFKTYVFESFMRAGEFNSQFGS